MVEPQLFCLKCLLSRQSLSPFLCIFSQTLSFIAHFTLFLLAGESCIDLSLHTFKNVVKSERKKKYFSPPPATEKRPRVPVSLQPHASTAHLFMEEEESKRAGMRKTEAGSERSPPRLRMILHSACSMSELLLLKMTLWAAELKRNL